MHSPRVRRRRSAADYLRTMDVEPDHAGRSSVTRAAAVETTARQFSARVSRRRFADPPLPRPSFFETTEVGVTNFASRRTRVTTVGDSGADDLTEELLRRWPWLGSLG